MEDKILPALIGAAVAVLTSAIAYFVQKAKLTNDFQQDVAQVRTGFMAESLVRALLEQYEQPFRTFVMIQHHVGGFSEDELRRILVRAGALRFMSKSGIELWALYERVKCYKASWDNEECNYLSWWKLPVDPKTPAAEELFPARLKTKPDK